MSMKTSIFVPITIVVLCLAALGVLVWQAIAPPPIVANNQVVAPPSVQVTPVSPATPTPAATEPSVVAPQQQAPAETSTDTGAGKDSGSGVGTTAVANFVDPACKTDGCSGQLCEDVKAPSVMTTCEMKPEYACYHQKGARCEVQKTGASAGHCGWSQSPELIACISSSKGASAQ